MSHPPLRLGVNVDHVATLRNARAGRNPDPVRAALLAIEAGADGITAHLREDRRHIRDDDMARLKAEISKPLNFEMAATPDMLRISLATRPHAVCLVPERREELTTEGGLDVVGQHNALAPFVARLNDAGHSRYYVDPKTARVVGSYSSRAWMSRWLYHGLHSLDFPWLYDHRPLWDIVVITVMLGGTALGVTALILAWRVLGAYFFGGGVQRAGLSAGPLSR